MTTIRPLLLWALAAACACVPSCSRPEEARARESRSDTPSVHVVNYPLKYFAERIAQGHARIEFRVPPGEDPAFWRPGRADIAAVQNADLILLNGAGYASWIRGASLPLAKLVDTSAAWRDRYIQVRGAVTHAHGPTGKHAHGRTAFTTWLDPTLAIQQAGAVRDALTKLRPAQSATFQAGFAFLEADLLDIDRQMRQAADGVGKQTLIASHPVYQYFGRAYGLNVRSVHWEPDEFPDAESWAEFRRALESDPAHWMIWEAQPLERTVRELKALGVDSVVIDPCGNAPAEGDFLTVLRRNAAALATIHAWPPVSPEPLAGG